MRFEVNIRQQERIKPAEYRNQFSGLAMIVEELCRKTKTKKNIYIYAYVEMVNFMLTLIKGHQFIYRTTYDFICI